MMLAKAGVGLLLVALLPPASSSFSTYSVVGGWKRKTTAQHDNRNAVLQAAPNTEPHGLWKALSGFSSEVIPPANAMDDPFPGIGLSIDSLYATVESKVETAVRAAEPVKKVVEPVAKATEPAKKTDQVTNSMEKASEQVSKASNSISKAFDSAFSKASEPAVQATSNAPAAQQATEQVIQSESAAKVVEPIVQNSDSAAKAVEPIVQNSGSIMKSSEPVVQTVTPVIKTGFNTIKPNDAMLQALEKNSALSKSISDAVHGSVEKMGAALTFKAPDLSLYQNKGVMANDKGSTVDFTGMFDNMKFKFEIPSADSVKFSPEQFTISPEQIEATRQNIAEFGKDYVATLESYYKLSEFQHAVVTGAAANEALGGFFSFASDVVDKLDFERNSGWYVSLVTFFWAATQRREGEIYGRMVADRKISQIESELATTKEEADKEATKKADEVSELKEQMELLKSQVQMLTDTAKDVREQLEHANGQQATEATSPKPVEVSEPVQIEEEVEVKSKPSSANKKSKTKGTKKKAPEVVSKSPETAKKGKRKTVKVKGTKSQVSPKQTSKSKEAPKKMVVSSEDWSRLSESTLKRKTVKELTGYLSEKGMDVKDADGKTLKKDNLVELVLSK